MPGSERGRIRLVSADTTDAAGVDRNGIGEVNQTVIGVNEDVATRAIAGIVNIAGSAGVERGETGRNRAAILRNQTDIAGREVPAIAGRRKKAAARSSRGIQGKSTCRYRTVVGQDSDRSTGADSTIDAGKCRCIGVDASGDGQAAAVPDRQGNAFGQTGR